jgi:Bacteriophage HK97-gp10, putative tail-component
MLIELRLEGLAELRKALRHLPAELTGEAAELIRAAADGVAAEIVAAYPERTGNLRRGVRVTHETSRFGAASTVRNHAPHAYIFEVGTVARKTAIGAPRGVMRPGKVFIPRAVRARRALYAAQIALLRRAGFEVSGVEVS